MIDIKFCIVANKREAGKNPESVWLLRGTKKSVAPAETRVVLMNVYGKRRRKRHKKRTVIRVFGRRKSNVTINTESGTEKSRTRVKAIPLQVWKGPEGSRRLRLPDFKTVGTWRW